MGASLTMIDRHYGHLARDGREHAIKLLDALNAPEFGPWTLWTLRGRRESRPASMPSNLAVQTVQDFAAHARDRCAPGVAVDGGDAGESLGALAECVHLFFG